LADGAAPRVELDLAGAAAGVEPAMARATGCGECRSTAAARAASSAEPITSTTAISPLDKRAGLVDGDDVDARRLLEEVGAGDDDAAAQRRVDGRRRW
jgi:hypothetical protein